MLPLHEPAALQRLPQLPAPSPGWVPARAGPWAGPGQGSPPDPLLSPASAFGDPHFVTFDGANFTFNGRGEYVLLESALTNLRVQARAQPRTTSEGEARVWGLGVAQGHLGGRLELSGPHSAPTNPGVQDQGTGLTAVAVQEDNSDVVEVRLASGAGILQVLLNGEVLSFAEQTWMDLKGEWNGRTRSELPSRPFPSTWAPHLSQALAGERDGAQCTDVEMDLSGLAAERVGPLRRSPPHPAAEGQHGGRAVAVCGQTWF